MATAESGGGEPRIGSAGATPGVHRVHRSGSSSVLEFLGAVSHFHTSWLYAPPPPYLATFISAIFSVTTYVSLLCAPCRHKLGTAGWLWPFLWPATPRPSSSIVSISTARSACRAQPSRQVNLYACPLFQRGSAWSLLFLFPSFSFHTQQAASLWLQFFRSFIGLSVFQPSPAIPFAAL